MTSEIHPNAPADFRDAGDLVLVALIEQPVIEAESGEIIRSEGQRRVGGVPARVFPVVNGGILGGT
ncbi:hypothetical protein N2604_25095 [Bradyrhizobium sp. CB1015]|nr:hypothetical protein [Bradyrhizobium sp. CB1015]UWU89760.1 hypothetical protein N2604_25095 [Bradyrhizobium sp. CB1015]